MEIYVSEKENINLKFNKRCELVILDSKPVIEMTEEELHQPIKTSKLLAYSLEQHDNALLKEFTDNLKTMIYDNSVTYYGLDDPNFSRNKMYIRSANVCYFLNELLKQRGGE